MENQQSLFWSDEEEAFKAFHTIDRQLFTRLLRNLGRGPTQSTRLMAFWMWLERESKDMNLVKNILSLPLPLLNRLVNETLLCLLCLQTDRFLDTPLDLLPLIVNNSAIISLRLFHENRIDVAQALARIISTVCSRAFADIMHPDEAEGDNSTIMSMNNMYQAISNIIDQDDHDDGTILQVPEDDRTIFLTFSKGYPITQDELTDFFTRRFGDFIEDLIMQEVGDDEQVLYARMVARSIDFIDSIVGGSKAKYVINGKHVWARKYVKKQQRHHQSTRPRSCQDPSSSSSTLGHGGL